MDLAFLGTGRIGAGMVENLLSRGGGVRVWNRTPERTAPLARLGAVPCAEVPDAVRDVSMVHLALGDDASVDATLLPALPALGPGTLLLDHTTTGPASTAERARALRERGLRYLHAPVFMSPAMCREAKGLMLVAGPRSWFEEVEGHLATMTGTVWWVGERPELAAAYKLFGNALIVALTGGLADVLALARNLGVDPEQALTLFQRFQVGGVVEGRGRKMARGDYGASFTLEMARKDVRLMLESAGEETLAVLPAIAARMDRLLAEGHGALDLAALSVGAVPPRAGG